MYVTLTSVTPFLTVSPTATIAPIGTHTHTYSNVQSERVVRV